MVHNTLASLDLRQTNITNDALQYISTITTITSLDIRSCTINDAGIEKLVVLESLKFLDVRGTDVTTICVSKLMRREMVRQKKLEKDGFLEKRGAVRKNWKRRFFTLCKDFLYYQKTPQDKKKLGKIELKGIKIQSAPEMKERPYCFKITTEKRVYYVHGYSHEETLDWIKSTIKLIHYKPLNLLWDNQ